MKGYLLNFYKYSALDNNAIFTNELEKDFVRSVVWSSFDRIEIREIFSFDQFRQSKYGEKNWVGERQFLMIYNVSDKSCPDRLDYVAQTKDKCYFSFEPTNGDTNKYRFFGITTIDLTPEVIDYFNYQHYSGVQMRKEFIKAIDNIIQQINYDGNICYDIFCTLGGNDLVVIWLSNQFEDIMTIIESLRYSTLRDESKVIANSSTIMGIKDINSDNIDFSDVVGNLNVRLTKKDSFDYNTCYKSLCKALNRQNIDIKTVLGEHDLLFQISGSDLANNLYREEGFIHIRNNAFFKNFFQANTEISVSLDYSTIKPYVFDFASMRERISIGEEYVETIQNCINTIVKSTLFENLPYLQETLWILYEDYMKNISSIFSYPWISDLYYYVSSGLLYLEEIVNDRQNNGLSNSDKYILVDFVISCIRQMILHVSQSNKLFFEVPNTHLKHTGSYSKILRAYQGIVKCFLELAYRIPKISRQSQIVPFISFDITPKVQSSACPSIIHDNKAIKLINIKVPYEALTNIPDYSFMLAHEIYHYIPPRDRLERNMIFGIITTNIIISQIILMYFDESRINNLNNIHFKTKSLQDNDKWRVFMEKFKPYIVKICLSNTLQRYKDIDKEMGLEKDVEWDKYYNKLESLLTRYKNKGKEFNTEKWIYSIMKSINYSIVMEDIKLTLEEKEFSYCDEIKWFIDYLIDIGEEGFENWLVCYKSFSRVIPLAQDIQYSTREALADYFMIQATDMSQFEYFNKVLHYKSILSGKSDNNIRQQFRMVIVLAFIYNLNADSIINWIKYFDLPIEQKAQIITTYNEYFPIIEIYSSLLKRVFDDLDFSKISTVFENFSNVLSFSKDMFGHSTGNLFEQNIHLIEQFQNQKSFGDIFCEGYLSDEYRKDISQFLNKILLDLGVKKYITHDRIKISRTIPDLLHDIHKSCDDISDNNLSQLWFRGHSNYKYKLLPSLYRIENISDSYNLRTTMEQLFKTFRVKSYNAPEIYDSNNQTKVATMVSMQHYSVPTNILDWSTSALVAIYFAVEKYMAYNSKELCNRQIPQIDASIWILNPLRLNVAREYLKTKMKDHDKHINAKSHPTPSLLEEEKDCKEFLPFISGEYDRDACPIAIYVPYVNQRIKAQVGTFTMFSLDVVGKKVVNDNNDFIKMDFSEYDLVELQKKYKKIVEQLNHEYKPFIQEVRISKECIIELADWLRQIGIEKSRIYPELTNISESVTNEIKNIIYTDQSS